MPFYLQAPTLLYLYKEYHYTIISTIKVTESGLQDWPFLKTPDFAGLGCGIYVKALGAPIHHRISGSGKGRRFEIWISKKVKKSQI